MESSVGDESETQQPTHAKMSWKNNERGRISQFLLATDTNIDGLSEGPLSVVGLPESFR
jgi:hypothetical protein